MISGALLRAGLGIGAKMFGKQIATEAIESGVSTAAGRVIGGRIMNFAAGSQVALGRAVGPKAAGAITSPVGRKLGTRMITKDVGNRLQGEGQFGPNTYDVKGPPQMVSTKSTTPSSDLLNPSSAPTTTPLSTPSGPSVNVADKPVPPGTTPGTWESGEAVDVNDRPRTGREYARDWQRARQGRKKQGSGTEGSGWMGTGKGWWQQNEQVSGAQAFSDPTKLGDFSVARGPAKYAMPKPGYQGYQALKAGGRGVRKGIRDARAEPEAAEFDPTMVGRQIGVPSMPTTPTVPLKVGQQMGTPTPRLESFNMGTQTASPEPVSAPTPSSTPAKTATPKPGLGQYGRDRFKEMMSATNMGSSTSPAPKVGQRGNPVKPWPQTWQEREAFGAEHLEAQKRGERTIFSPH